MNELYINDCWIYFKTNEDSATAALDKLFEICEDNGIELVVEKYALRNENGEDIEEE